MASRSSFGKFKLLQRIGGGRLSEVYRISSLFAKGGKIPSVVLKRVSPALIAENTFVQLVAREAGLLSRLEHENLCLCDEMGVIDGCAFLTIDLVDGCTLRALMRRLSKMGIRLPTSAILAIATQAAQVLQYLHVRAETPVIHLDLSPQNVMISREGTLKLIDFGIARYIDGHDPPPLSGKIAGTVGYMSPEQARGDSKIDARADQFALGILLWEMFAGQRLYPGGNEYAWARMCRGETPPISSILPTISPELGNAIDKLLEAKPSDRYPDMTAFLQVLTSLSSSPLSGKRPLAALTNRLMNDDDFDPFDVVERKRHSAPNIPPKDIPTGELALDHYDEISIDVDHGAGTPSEQMRAIVPDKVEQPIYTIKSEEDLDSPFLEPSASFDMDFHDVT